MSIKYICDLCGSEAEGGGALYEFETFLATPIRGAKIGLNITRSIDGVWNDGHLCLKCLGGALAQVVTDAPQPEPCPTCSGPIRETVGMVCQTCGTDYAPQPDAETEQTVWHDEAARYTDTGKLDPPDRCLCENCAKPPFVVTDEAVEAAAKDLWARADLPYVASRLTADFEDYAVSWRSFASGAITAALPHLWGDV